MKMFDFCNINHISRWLSDHNSSVHFQAYEEPDNPELSLRTVGRTIKETVQELINLLEDKV